jgi:hypothetical protein
MKNKLLTHGIIFVLFLLFPISSFAGGEWVAHECAICEKTVYEWEEDHVLLNDGSSGLITWGPPAAPGLGARYIRYDTEYMVCPDCAKTYRQKLKDFMDAMAQQWLSFKGDDNLELRQKHKAKRNVRKIEELEKRINKIQRELDELK